MSKEDSDPLLLAGLEPASIAQAKQNKTKKAPSEAEIAKEKRLQAKESRLGMQNKFSPPPPEKKTPYVEDVYTEVHDKSKLLDKLYAYRKRFPHLEKRNNVSAKSDVEEILDELHHCEVQLGQKKDSGGIGGMLLHGTMVGIEHITRDVWNPLGLNLNGLGQITKDSMDEFQPLVDEMMIKYGTGMYLSVEVRLALMVGATVMTVHSANSGDPRVAQALKKMNNVAQAPAGSSDL